MHVAKRAIKNPVVPLKMQFLIRLFIAKRRHAFWQRFGLCRHFGSLLFAAIAHLFKPLVSLAKHNVRKAVVIEYPVGDLPEAHELDIPGIAMIGVIGHFLLRPLSQPRRAVTSI